MFEITIITSGVLLIILLKIFLNINFKEIKKLEFRNKEELEKVSKKFSNDEKICNDILSKLDKKDVKVKIEPEYTSCVYTIFNNTITLGKFKQDYMKPQTIAHECIHASQSKRMLWANFIFSNIYLIFFVVISALTFFSKVHNTNVFAIILIFASIVQYILRFTLENEAMIKAKYLAKEYIEEEKILTKDETEKLMEEYDAINRIGIPFTNYYLITMNIIKVIFYAFISLSV